MTDAKPVPHPLHLYLLNLQKTVRAAQYKMAAKLDRPDANFAAGNVWVGPTADSWGAQLKLKRTSYRSELARLDAVVSARLAATPPTCSADEAEKWKRRLSHG